MEVVPKPESAQEKFMQQLFDNTNLQVDKIIDTLHLKTSRPLIASKLLSQLEDVYTDFSSRMPKELNKFPMLTSINAFYMLSDDQVLLLLYRTSSVLQLFTLNQNTKPVEVTVTEDSLQDLVIDPGLGLVLVGGGLFECKVFIYALPSLTAVAALSTSSPVSFIIGNRFKHSVLTLQKDAGILEWDLNNPSSKSVISNESFHYVGVCEEKNWIALAMNYGKVVYLADEKYELKEQRKIKSLKVSNSGYFIAMDTLKSITVLELKSSVLSVRQYRECGQLIADYCFSPSDVLVIALVNGNIEIWDQEKNRMPITLKISRAKLIGCWDNNLIYAIGTNTLYSFLFPKLPIQYECENTFFSSFSPSSTKFAYVEKDKNNVKNLVLKILNLVSGIVSEVRKLEKEVTRVAFITEDLIFLPTKSEFALYSIGDRRAISIPNEDEDMINSVYIDPSNDLFYTGGSKQNIKIFSINPLKLLSQFGTHSSGVQLVLPFQKGTKLMTKTINGLFIWDIITKEQIWQYEVKALSLSLSPDDKFAFFSTVDNIFVYDLESSNMYFSFGLSKFFCFDSYATKDSKFVVTTSTDGLIRFWDTLTFSCMFSLKTVGEIKHIKFSQDENFFAYRVDLKFPTMFVIRNPLKDKSIGFYSPNPDYYGYLSYFIDLKDRKEVEYQAKFENTVILPHFLTNLHLYALHGKAANVKQALNGNEAISQCSEGLNPLDITLLYNHKNTALIFLKFFIKKLEEFPLLGRAISIQSLIAMNALGFESLLDFYDSILIKNKHASLPFAIEKSIGLPKTIANQEFVPQKEWFFNQDMKESGVPIEFLTSAIRLNMVQGSHDSVNFLRSLTLCPYPDIFRSKFIQLCIDYKWSRNWFYVALECFVFLIYLIFLCVVSLGVKEYAIAIIFYLTGYSLTLYNVLQVLGGVKAYFKDVWNIVDLARGILLICFTWSNESNSDSYYTVILILNLFSWARGISYFRIFSRTRYLIHLLTEVITDVLPFIFIGAYSTIAFSFILMLMNLGATNFSDYFTLSYLIMLGSINSASYNTIQWVCFIAATIINPIIMMNLIISLMGDTYDRVQEGREVADYKELTFMCMQSEIATLWQRGVGVHSHLHLCKEVETKNLARNWQGKIREIKGLIYGMRAAQAKTNEANSQLLLDNQQLKDQISRIEGMLIGLRGKMNEDNEEQKHKVLCKAGHGLEKVFFVEQTFTCDKCKKQHEFGFYCRICAYGLCKPCFKQAHREKVGNSEFLCFRGHKLKWLSTQEEYKDYSRKVFFCATCKKKMSKESYNCIACQWDLCRKCVDIVIARIPLAWTKQCPNNHNLVWHPKPHNSYRCNACQQTFTKAGSFNCLACDYDVCVRCFDSLF
jgi:WD40 repeat protein